MHRQEADLTKGLMAGVAADLLASFLMEQFQSFWNKLSTELNPRRDESESKDEPSTVQAAQAISTGLTNQKIRKENTPAAGEIIHYVMGGILGAIYGVAAEITPLATAGEGLVFGTSVMDGSYSRSWRSLPLATASQGHA
ncbi:MAG: hypothetical protein C5B58_02240 [Acidobacteria bacterium]|nr:MAG: hypothetical protein C5B58_02240 [Acidobacteriota bacterium]